MKKLLITSAILCLSSGMAFADESCSTEAAENGTDTKVISADGTYLGYVSPNRDGSYFMWLAGKGAMNQSAQSYGDAVDFVCNTTDDGE